MSDEIKDRLRNSAEACLKSYEAWAGNKKDGGKREDLQDTVHELRKVASRLEIEIAISERNESGNKQIPIPPHRDARGRGNNNDAADDEKNNGNQAAPAQAASSGVTVEKSSRPRRRPAPQKSAGGEG
ncbi:MAG: hypothetical protein KDI46_03165 [Alphaproteobacteria bacterium]|nr:hypothetical protein [Alphaproteobacteria bacterium]